MNAPSADRRPTTRVFVGGCERSGTTFVAAQISRWTGLTFLPESYFLIPCLREFEATGGNLLEMIMRQWRLRAWGIPADEFRAAARGSQCAQAIVDAMARRYADQLGYSRFLGWIEHTPFNTSQTLILDRHFSDHKYINVYRDGRAVAASILNVDFGPTTVRTAAMWWQQNLLPGLVAHLLEPERVMLLRYEDAIANPEDTKAKVLQFLGTDAVAEGGTPPISIDDIFRRTHQLVPKQPDRSRIDAWRSQLTRKQIEIFESLAGSTLHGLGYRLETSVARQATPMIRYLDRILDAVLQLCWQLPIRAARFRLSQLSSSVRFADK